MAKFITLTRLAPAQRDFARERFLGDALRRLALSPTPVRYTVNLADVTPSNADEAPRYDIVEEVEFPSTTEFASWRRAVATELPSAVASAVEAAFDYHVSERTQLDDCRAPVLGERSPGVKAIYVVRRNPALSDAEASRRWLEHAAVARRHHVGMSRYVQNGVVASLSPDAPVVNGIAVLHFPTLADLEEHMYDNEAGREAVASDVAALVAETHPLYTSEYVLRA